jgi:hypothetical protein
MNDLEAQIREALIRHEADAPAFDPSDARHAASRTRRRQIVNVAAIGVGALAVVIGLAVGLGGLVRADPGPTVLHQPPSVVTRIPGEKEVSDWPDMSRNPPGLYSWDGVYDGKYNTNEGFMHNGYASGDLEIHIALDPGASIAEDDGATPVTVAGHNGIYRRIDARHEVWLIAVDANPILIELETHHDVTDAELAEAYAIIASMRTEQRDNELGFRLVFMLTTNDWDSG